MTKKVGAAWRKRVEQIPMEGCTVKLNVLLGELPNFTARPGTDQPHHYGRKSAFAAARCGDLPPYLWCEFQSVHDRTITTAGRHTMSVFAQYVPYKFARGIWDDRREEVRRLALTAPPSLSPGVSPLVGVAVKGVERMEICNRADETQDGAPVA